MHAEIHAGGERAALQAVAAERGRIEAGGGGAGLHDARDGARIDRLGADGGRRGTPPRAGGSQMRRNSGPSVIPAASCQRRSARTGQSAVVPSGRATVTPVPARSPLESGRVRRSPRGAASRCSRRIAASLRRAAIRYLHYLAGCAVPTAEAVVGETPRRHPPRRRPARRVPGAKTRRRGRRAARDPRADRRRPARPRPAMVLTARPRWRSAARNATTSAADAGRQGSAWRAHQAHQAATPAR